MICQKCGNEAGLLVKTKIVQDIYVIKIRESSIRTKKMEDASEHEWCEANGLWCMDCCPCLP